MYIVKIYAHDLKKNSMGCCVSQQDTHEDTVPLCRQSFSSSISESSASSVRASPPSPGTPLLFSDDGSSDSGYYTPEELLSV